MIAGGIIVMIAVSGYFVGLRQTNSAISMTRPVEVLQEDPRRGLSDTAAIAPMAVRYIDQNWPAQGVNALWRTSLVDFVPLPPASEVFVEFYTGGSHTSAAKYLYFGLHGHNELVPWIWSAVAATLIAVVLFMRHGINRSPVLLNTACLLAFAGIWIEKGMGMILPAFIPSTLHEIVEYRPSVNEWKITAGIWALGFMIYTLLLKITVNVYSRKQRDAAGNRTIASTDALAMADDI